MNTDKMAAPRARDGGWRAKRRRELWSIIERAFAILDEIDGDPDLEDDGSAEASAQPEIRGGALVVVH